MPLVLWIQDWKNAFRRIIVPAGYSDFDYHDPLVNYQISGNEWASFYESLADAIKSKVHYDAIEINGIRTEVTGENWHKENDIAPFCDLGQFTDSENFLESLKASLRGDIRRQIRRIGELGPLSLYQYNTVEEALNILPQFLKLHSDRWPGAYKAPEFHKNLIVYGLKSGIIQLTSLKSGDKTLSYHLGFTQNKTYYYYMPAIDPEYENLSPGKVHLFKFVERAIADGIKIFDHLRGDENYKEGWTTSVQSLYRFSYQNTSLASKFRNGLYSIKKRII
jgi:CelD/BcsL family acetyltransferase involved in cellulose biosynthesis